MRSRGERGSEISKVIQKIIQKVIQQGNPGTDKDEIQPDKGQNLRTYAKGSDNVPKPSLRSDAVNSFSRRKRGEITAYNPGMKGGGSDCKLPKPGHCCSKTG